MITKSKDEISQELIPKFNILIDRLSLKHQKNIYWLTSEIASRNNLECKFFSSLVNNTYHTKKFTLQTRPIYMHLMTATIKSMKLFCNHFFRFAAARILLPKAQITKTSILIDSFILPDTFTKNGKYQDRYYSFFANQVPQDQLENIIYLPTFLMRPIPYIKTLLKIKKSQHQFLLKEHYLKIQDVFAILKLPYEHLKLTEKTLNFDGRNIAPIYNHYLLKGASSNNTAEGILKYKFAKRLSKLIEPPKRLLNWFENQPQDRGLNYGFRKYFPTIEAIGYQGMAIPNAYLSLNPTEAEYKSKVTPEFIWVTAKPYLKQKLRQYPQAKIQVGPYFRQANYATPSKIPKSQYIAAALPLQTEYASAIIKCLSNIKILPDLQEVRIQIFKHPDMAPATLEHLLLTHSCSNKKNIELSTASIFQNIHQFSIIISNSSSVCLEALANGIPVLVAAQKDLITCHTIPEDIPNKYWDICYDGIDIEKKIKKLTSMPLKDRQHIAKEIQENYFTKPTEENVKALLGLD